MKYWYIFWARVQANLHGLWWLLWLEPHQQLETYDAQDEVLQIACTCGKVFYQLPPSPEWQQTHTRSTTRSKPDGG